MFKGLLVDLVPFGKAFLNMEHRWLNGPGVFFWAVGGRWIMSQRQVKEWQQEIVEDQLNGDLRMRFGVQTKDGTPIGLFALNHVHPHHRLAMLSAFIGDPDYWGGGYGTDALLLVADYAFNWLDVHKLWLQTMAVNARVLRQMEKVGFTLEANSREATWTETAWVDMPTYGLLREEWPGREAMIQKLGLKVRA